ncbi:MAG: alpha/beta hydrolase [Arcticibacter sp.]
MNSKEHNIVVQRTARYFSVGGEDPAHDVLIVLHGYGMNAGRFIDDFEHIVSPRLKVVAPEGLSRFYRRGFEGDVIASWMTKEDRLSEIADQRFFLDRLYDDLIGESERRVFALGFSQGTATASRWMAGNPRRFSGLILWGGDFAPDAEEPMNGIRQVHCVAGNQDQFIPLPLFEERCICLENKGYEAIRTVFDGGHEIIGTVLADVWKQII